MFVRTFVTVQLFAGPPPSQQQPPCLAAVLCRRHWIQPKEALASIERKLDVWCNLSPSPSLALSLLSRALSLYLSRSLARSSLVSQNMCRIVSSPRSISHITAFIKVQVVCVSPCLVPLSSHIRSTEVSFPFRIVFLLSFLFLSVEIFQLLPYLSRDFPD